MHRDRDLPDSPAACSSPTAGSRPRSSFTRGSTSLSSLPSICSRMKRGGTPCAAIIGATPRSPASAASASSWRARRGAARSDWGDKLGYTPQELDEANREAIELLSRDPRRALPGRTGRRGSVGRTDSGAPGPTRRGRATPSSTRLRSSTTRSGRAQPPARGPGGLVPHINVLGGCCGTDHRHVAQICATCQSLG